ncbi:MAG: hypothetical protein DLM70_09560 [Chloroflexi bacterium]|nr:MAG: hypothetical protein DLM70_09560 [Chloroflexota bacterium]
MERLTRLHDVKVYVRQDKRRAELPHQHRILLPDHCTHFFPLPAEENAGHLRSLAPRSRIAHA